MPEPDQDPNPRTLSDLAGHVDVYEQDDPQYLRLPTDAGYAMIPTGLTGDDFDRLMQALPLYRSSIVTAAPPPGPASAPPITRKRRPRTALQTPKTQRQKAKITPDEVLSENTPLKAESKIGGDGYLYD